MAVINFAGWAAGSVNQEGFGGTGGTLSVVSAGGHAGENALRCNPTGTGTGVGDMGAFTGSGIGNQSSFLTNLYAGFWFKVHTLPATNDEPIAAWLSSVSTLRGELRIRSDGKLAIYDAALSSSWVSSSALSVDTWYYISGKLNGSTSGQTDIYVGGSVFVSSSSIANFGGNISFIRIGKGANRNSNSVDFYYSTLVIDDANLPTFDLYVTNIYANAAGSTQDFGAGVGYGDYRDVAETVVDGIGSYLQATATSQVSLFGLQSCADASVGSADSIVSLKAGIEVAESAAGTSSFKMRLRSGSTNSDNTAFDPGTTFGLRYRMYNTDPATSAAWDQAGVNAVEVGAVDNSSGGRCQISWAAAMLLVKPAAAASGTSDAGATASGAAGANVGKTGTITAGADASARPKTYNASGTADAGADASAAAGANKFSTGGVTAGADAVGSGYADDQTYVAGDGIPPPSGPTSGPLDYFRGNTFSARFFGAKTFYGVGETAPPVSGIDISSASHPYWTRRIEVPTPEPDPVIAPVVLATPSPLQVQNNTNSRDDITPLVRDLFARATTNATPATESKPLQRRRIEALLLLTID